MGRKYGYWWHSIVASAVLIAFVYLFDNLPFPFRESTELLTTVENIENNWFGKTPLADTTRIFINTGYDLALVSPRPFRQLKITDRGKILRLLRDLDTVAYKAIFIDIRFEKGLVTPVDSMLVSQILGMRNTYVAKHWNPETKTDYPLIDGRLLDKAVYADYASTIYHASFSRYQFIQANGPSAALKLYEDVDQRHISRIGRGLFSLYFDRGWLCNNASFIRIPEDFSSGEKGGVDNKQRFYDLGEDLYGWDQGSEFQHATFSRMKDKVIIVGDFVYDMHGTYFGKQPGPYLNYLAYDTLRSGKHLVNPFLAICVFIVYFLIFFSIFNQISTPAFFQWVKRRKWYQPVSKTRLFSALRKVRRMMRFVLSFIGYGFLFSVFCAVTLILFNTSVSVFLPTLSFSLVHHVIQYKHYE